MVEYSQEELIKIIQEYSNIIGRTPKMREVAYNKHLPPINQFLKIFGTWNKLLKLAGLKINVVWRYDDDYLLQKLIDIKGKTQRNPKLEDLK